jgi:outer membrane protein OmpA-like peptidoglycan-associated protein
MGEGGNQMASPQSGGSNGDARPVLGNGDMRQIRNSAGQIANDVQELRRQLQGGAMDPADLRSVDDVVNGLRSLAALGSSADPHSIEQLTAQALEKMQKVEYDIRKKVDQSNQQLFLAGSDEIAPQFKKPVDDYFHALSNSKASGVRPNVGPSAPQAPAKGKGQ